MATRRVKTDELHVEFGGELGVRLSLDRVAKTVSLWVRPDKDEPFELAAAITMVDVKDLKEWAAAAETLLAPPKVAATRRAKQGG